MKRKTNPGWLVLLGILPLLGIPGCRGAGGRETSIEPKNLVIIVSDALRRDVLGCYGGPAHTPNIDRLAREGTVFDNAYSTAPCTMPSSVAMLTGNYSRTYAHYLRQKKPGRAHFLPKEFYCFYVPDNELMLAESLARKGWITRAVIENSVVKRSNILQGFTLLPRHAKGRRDRSVVLQKWREFSEKAKRERYMRSVLDFLSSVPRNRSFFLLHWIADPHAPYASVPGKPNALSLFEGSLPHPPGYYSSKRCNELQKLMRKGSLSGPEMEYIRARYRAEVESVDERVGRILRVLENRGRLKETLVVFTSDHGELLGGHDRIGHGRAFFQELVCVPLIFRGPGIPRHKRISSMVTHLGLTPTMKDFCGLPASRIWGKSYSSLFSDDGPGEPMAYFDAISNSLDRKRVGWDAAVQNGFKLIVNRQVNERAEKTLYHLVRDPGETVDRAEDFPEQVKALSREIGRIRAEIRRRLKKNASRLKESLDLGGAARKAHETLKSLGYL